MKGILYLEGLTKGSAIRIEQLGAKFGKGAVATRPIAEGEEIIVEKPFAIQQIESKAQVRACENCFRCLDSSPELLDKMTEGQVLLGPKLFPTLDFQPVPCASECGEWYCSPQCLQEALDSHHKYLCVGQCDSEMHPLYQFKKQAYESNEIFLLAAKLVLSIKSELLSGKNDLKDTIDVILKKPWWEVVLLPEDEKGMSAEEWVNQLKGMIKASFSLFHQALNDDRFPEIFSFDYFANLCGMFELNDYGIMVEPPLKTDLESLYMDQDFAKNKKKFITQIKTFLKPVIQQNMVSVLPNNDNEWFETFVEYVPLIEGNAFGSIVACMNHSCDPNAYVQYEHNKDAHLIALRDIEEGEQIFIAYVDVDEPVEVRRKDLLEHGFVCDCPKCLEEAQGMEVEKEEI